MSLSSEVLFDLSKRGTRVDRRLHVPVIPRLDRFLPVSRRGARGYGINGNPGEAFLCPEPSRHGITVREGTAFNNAIAFTLLTPSILLLSRNNVN